MISLKEGIKMSRKQLALRLLNAVWNENESEVLFCLKQGANPSWISDFDARHLYSKSENHRTID